MPTYEYQCAKCNKIFEELQYISEPPIEVCIYCGGKSKKIISGGAGIIFKGSGFYVNDSKKTSSTSAPVTDKTQSNPVNTDNKNSEISKVNETNSSSAVSEASEKKDLTNKKQHKNDAKKQGEK